MTIPVYNDVETISNASREDIPQSASQEFSFLTNLGETPIAKEKLNEHL